MLASTEVGRPSAKAETDIYEEGALVGFGARVTAKLIRKIDIHLLPCLALLYLLSFLDRSNMEMRASQDLRSLRA